MSQEVLFVKLKNGEDLVTQIEDYSVVKNIETNSYTIINPKKIMYSISQSKNALVVTLVQWVFSSICADKSFVISRSDILAIGTPSEEMVAHYHSAVESQDVADETGSTVASMLSVDSDMTLSDIMEMVDNRITEEDVEEQEVVNKSPNRKLN